MPVCGWRESRTPGCCRAAAPSSTTSYVRAWCTRASCGVPMPGRDSDRSTSPERCRFPACVPCSPPRICIRWSGNSGTCRWERTFPTRLVRHWPTVRSATSATRSRSSWRTTVTSPRTAPIWWRWSTSRARRSSTTPPHATPRSGCTTPTRATSPAHSGGRSPSGSERSSRPPPMTCGSRSTNRRMRRCRWRPAGSSPTGRVTSSRCGRRPNHRTRSGCSSPVSSASTNTRFESWHATPAAASARRWYPCGRRWR